MTEEELETREKLKLMNIAKDWLRTEHSEGNVQSLVNLILSFTEPKDRRIAELEETIKQLQKQILEFTRELHTSNKENSELKEQISIKDILIKELQEQKVYWKKSSFDWRHKFFKLDKVKRLIKKDKQLNKAKELLKQWIELYKPKLEGYPITPIQEQTEQFLKDSEVEK